MGFRKEPTVYKLHFEDMEGLEVVAKSLPLKDFLSINKLAATSQDDAAKATEATEGMLKKFSEALISWNLEDEHGKSVPATYTGLLTQETWFVMTIVQAWMAEIGSVPKLSKNNSNSTGTYPEVSIPMAVS